MTQVSGRRSRGKRTPRLRKRARKRSCSKNKRKGSYEKKGGKEVAESSVAEECLAREVCRSRGVGYSVSEGGGRGLNGFGRRNGRRLGEELRHGRRKRDVQ